MSPNRVKRRGQPSMAFRARRIGRRETPIRLSNPSKRISSGLSPVTMHTYHADQVWFVHRPRHRADDGCEKLIIVV